MSQIQSRLRLEEARFFYEQMNIHFQDRIRFLFFLDAFLASARSVTHVFQKEFHENVQIMNWYEREVAKWKDNKIMRLFTHMRNISLKEHTPKMRTTVAKSLSASFTIANKVSIRKIIGEKTEQVDLVGESTKQSRKEEQVVTKGSGIVDYSFDELPRWFDENPDVMYLCGKYLDYLEKFVSEAEIMIKEIKP